MKRVSTARWYEKHNRWQINVQKDGKRRSFYSSVPGRKGQRECHEKADAWLEAGWCGEREKASALYKKWMAELKLLTSKGHWKQYESIWRNWMKERIGHLRMESLTEQHFQDILNDAYQKGLSKKTLMNMKGCFAS